MPRDSWFYDSGQRDPRDVAQEVRDATVERAVTRFHSRRIRELQQEAAKAGYHGGEFATYMAQTITLSPESYPSAFDADGVALLYDRRPLSRRDVLTREVRAYEQRLVAEQEGHDGDVPFDPTAARMEHKGMPSYGIKASTSTGQITGYLAAFSNVDATNDIIVPGAFKASLAERAQSGRPLPILWQHDMTRPIGKWTDLREDRRGLHGTGVIDASIADGQRALSGIKMGYLRGLSIGYVATQEGRDRQGHRLLKGIHLMEASVVTFPANSDATIETVD